MTPREAIEQAGGLASQADVARLLNISRQRVAQLLQEHDDFPRPIGDRWLVSEVKDWQRRRSERLRKRRQRGSPGAARLKP